MKTLFLAFVGIVFALFFLYSMFAPIFATLITTLSHLG